MLVGLVRDCSYFCASVKLEFDRFLFDVESRDLGFLLARATHGVNECYIHERGEASTVRSTVCCSEQSIGFFGRVFLFGMLSFPQHEHDFSVGDGVGRFCLPCMLLSLLFMSIRASAHVGRYMNAPL